MTIAGGQGQEKPGVRLRAEHAATLLLHLAPFPAGWTTRAAEAG